MEWQMVSVYSAFSRVLDTQSAFQSRNNSPIHTLIHALVYADTGGKTHDSVHLLKLGIELLTFWL